MGSTSSTSSRVSLWATILGWFRGSAPSPSAAAQLTSAPDDSEHNEVAGNYVITPSGYQIRVPTGSAIPDAIDNLLPDVRKGLSVIPPLPQVVIELLREVQNPKASASSVAAVISNDPALAASVLRMANRAACGLSRKVTAVPEAVSYLGFGVVKSLVLRLRLDSVLPSGSQASQEMRELWTHTLAVSYIADVLAESVGGVDRGFVSTLALLHDIGKIALITRFPDRAQALKQAMASGNGESILAHEAKLLGADHAAMGASLALQWKLPADLVAAIRWHHFPQRAFGPTEPPALSKAVAIVQVANQLAKFCYVYSDEMQIESVSPASLAALGLGESLEQLLSPKVRAAAARAIFMAEESAEQSSAAAPRVLVFHDGDSAARLVQRIEPGAQCRATRLNADVEGRLQNAATTPGAFERTLKTPSAEQVRGLMDALRSHLQTLELRAEQSQSAALIAQSILAYLAVHVSSPVQVVEWIESDRLHLGFRSASLGFGNRFGVATEPARCLVALETELASLLNLGWIDSADTDPTGECLVLNIPVAHGSQRRGAVDGHASVAA